MKAIVLRNPKTFKHKLHAVSPVVATLILIVVAIIGAIAVGLIVSNVANTTNKQVAGNNAGGDAQGTLTIGGSTTIYPVTSSAVAAFEAEYPGITVQVAQGGSGAGMEGVIIGAVDIGEASSYPTVSSYSASAASLTPPVNLVATNIGGSGVVAIEHGPATGGFLDDGSATDICYGLTSAAAEAIWTDGAFYIANGGCSDASPIYGVLQATYVCNENTAAVVTATLGEGSGCTGAATTAYSVKYTAVSRSDIPSGTQETFGAWAGFSSSAQDTSQFGGAGLGTTATGNPGVLSAVETTTDTIGFVDIGFAEQQTLLTTPSTLAIPAMYTSTTPYSGSTQGDSTAPATLGTGAGQATPVACSSATVPATPTSVGIYCYAAESSSTKNIDTTIKNALSGAGPEFPDNNAGTNQLSRTFWYVTNGEPTPVEQDWINFIINPGSSTYFTNQGYYSVYQYKTG